MPARVGIAALLAAAGLAGCGRSTRTAQNPPLPGPLAQRLAAQSDGVAAALAGGDPCAARARGRALQIRTIREINARHVPRVYQDQLMSAVNEVVAQLPACPAPAATAPASTTPAKAEGKHKEKHGKKHKRHGHGGKHGDGEGGDE
jgi:hypothetical protein